MLTINDRTLPRGALDIQLPPVRAATVISLINLVKTLPRLASNAPFLCLIVCHLECPDILLISLILLSFTLFEIYHGENFPGKSAISYLFKVSEIEKLNFEVVLPKRFGQRCEFLPVCFLNFDR